MIYIYIYVRAIPPTPPPPVRPLSGYPLPPLPPLSHILYPRGNRYKRNIFWKWFIGNRFQRIGGGYWCCYTVTPLDGALLAHPVAAV